MPDIENDDYDKILEMIVYTLLDEIIADKEQKQEMNCCDT